ncbi:hypothetical protein BURPS1710b_1483 [Burkholderia pseudomallei 1710b]|uniref:Uncharacterized protein n=1 Tax=Burkholderia pseudomallei (strain 1710b) TaxID=320372 RepID=Q3JU66_BURP1|nr:hypothetical protein BURPS1710b_1483 [Burkholderia pseudomallei 1710b]
MDRVSGRPAIARRPERRRDRRRHGRRNAARVRARGGRRFRLRRQRTARAIRRSHRRAARFADSRRRRSARQEDCAQQGLECSLPARERAAAREDRLPRHHARLPRARRCTRGIRAARRRRLGDLGPLSCGDRASDERARDREWRRAREQHPILSREPYVRRSRAAARARAARRSRRGRSLGARECRHCRRPAFAARRARHGNARTRVEARELWRATDRRRRARVSAANRRHVHRPQADSAQDRRRRRALASGIGARAAPTRRTQHRRVGRFCVFHPLVRLPSRTRHRYAAALSRRGYDCSLQRGNGKTEKRRNAHGRSREAPEPASRSSANAPIGSTLASSFPQHRTRQDRMPAAGCHPSRAIAFGQRITAAPRRRMSRPARRSATRDARGRPSIRVALAMLGHAVVPACLDHAADDGDGGRAPGFRAAPERVMLKPATRPRMRLRVDRADPLAQLDLPPGASQPLDERGQRAVGGPFVETAAASRRRRIAARQRGPALAGRQHPQHRIRDRARLRARPAATRIAHRLGGQQPLDTRPFVIAQLFELHRRPSSRNRRKRARECTRNARRR